MKKIIFALFFMFSMCSNAFAYDLHLYSGENYLGCFTCNAHSSESICNKFGRYGSDFNTYSVWNTFGTYGNEFNQVSPWNEFSAHEDVPIIVDSDGNFYGYFTINKHRIFAMESAGDYNKAYKYYKGDLEKMRNFVCQ